MATAATQPIVFAGSPDALEAIVPVAPATRRSVRIVPDDDRDDLALRVLTVPVSAEATLVRVVLGTTTAPGEYRARIVTDGGEFPAVISVAPQPHISLHPATLVFDCPPGGSASLGITIQNVGNTTVAPRSAYAVGLMEDGAIDAAINHALAMRTRDSGESRFERAGDALADRYAGLARLVISELSGPIGPGSTGTATVELRLEDRAFSGRHYHGLWAFEGSRIPVSVTTTRQADPPAVATNPSAEESE